MWAVWKSRAVLAIAPLQDVLDLGTDARMNLPGTTDGNWQWRARTDALTDDVVAKMRALNKATRRKPGRRMRGR